MTARRLRSVAVAVAALVAAVCLAPGAVAETGVADRVETARSGTWTAELRLRVGGDPSYAQLRGLHLRVTRGGARALERDLSLPKQCRGGGCVLPDVKGYRTLALRSLGAPVPAVVLSFWTGGAHCCTVIRAIELPGGRSADRDFGNGGAVIERVDGVPVFRAQDERFPYRYTSYAASGSPIAFLAFTGGRFVDVTREHPAAVRENARDWWRTYVSARSDGSEVRGVFAAWAADVCLLGDRARVEARLADGVRLGLFAPPRAESFGPYGAAYARTLLRDLEQLRYCAPG